MGVEVQPSCRRSAHHPFLGGCIDLEHAQQLVDFVDRIANVLATAGQEAITAELQQCGGEYGQRLS